MTLEELEKNYKKREIKFAALQEQQEAITESDNISLDQKIKYLKNVSKQVNELKKEAERDLIIAIKLKQ